VLGYLLVHLCYRVRMNVLSMYTMHSPHTCWCACMHIRDAIRTSHLRHKQSHLVVIISNKHTRCNPVSISAQHTYTHRHPDTVCNGNVRNGNRTAYRKTTTYANVTTLVTYHDAYCLCTLLRNSVAHKSKSNSRVGYSFYLTFYLATHVLRYVTAVILIIERITEFT
jgi:hypothetical protein